MKLLKGALIFMSGAVTFSLLLAKSLVHRADNPYEGSIVCETDEFKVISMNPQRTKGKVITITQYKDHE